MSEAEGEEIIDNEFESYMSKTLPVTNASGSPIVDPNVEDTDSEEKQSVPKDSSEMLNDLNNFNNLNLSHYVEEIDLLKKYPLNFSELQDSRITYIEAWDLNLYIGTDHGEIIHMYKLDEISGYVQISKQKLSTKFKPIRKLIVLSEISMMLVHYGFSVIGLHLPELSPANIGKAKNVVDITLDHDDIYFDDKIKSTRVATHIYHDQIFTKVILFTNQATKFLKIFKDSMKLYKELVTPEICGGLCLGNIMVCNTEREYCIYDFSREQTLCTLPLLHDLSLGMPPIIEVVHSEELFIVGGGGDRDAPAVGMFINKQGDVTRGTIAFEQYPQYVCIESPFIFSSVGNKISIYSIENQEKLQELQVDNVIFLQLFKCARAFGVKNSELEKQITLVPLVSTMDNYEIQRIAAEADTAVEKSVCFSKVISADSMGNYIKVLKPQSRYDRLIAKFLSTNQDNSTLILDQLKLELKENPKDCFIIMLIGIFILKWKIVDQFLQYWGDYLSVLDPRLVIYAFQNDERAFVIYGSVWTYHCFVEYFEDLQQGEKSTEFLSAFYGYLSRCCLYQFESDHIDKMKSVEIALLKVGSLLKKDLIEVVEKVKYARDEVVEELLRNKQYLVLSLFYKKINEPREFLFYWKGLISGEFIDPEFIINYRKLEALKLSSEYVLTNCLNDEVIVRSYTDWLFSEDPLYAMQFINDSRLSNIKLNDLKILKTLRLKESPILMDFLEYIFEIKNEKQFIGDLILSYFNTLRQFLDSHIDDSKEIKEALSTYVKMKRPKMSIFKYWNYIDNSVIKSEKVSSIHKKLYGLLSSIPNETKSVFEQQSVLDWCNTSKGLLDLKETFPLIHLVLIERTASNMDVLNLLIDLKDYKSSELYAINLSLSQIDSEFLQRDETSLSIAIDKMDVLQKLLLERIFTVYLKNNENELIDEFLLKYDLLNSDLADEVSTIKRAEKCVGVINRVPDDFPVLRLKRFLINQLVEMEICNQELVVKRAIMKLEISRMTKLKDLQLSDV
ncbi:hypothetical protein CANINC_000110 [Pichia inconspicua]|uniref:CNH domain-containing protein n=1 Tax=Pichia inconspicua TaxID=52247 RepID=A0A4T0X750_9ASCO|nr:hypothetical protein CANINC_000110 [[Candida] inconspicua]